MTDVLTRNAATGAWETLNITNLGAVTAPANGGLLINANSIGFDATVGGAKLLNTNGVLSVVIPGMGAPVAITTAGAGTLTAASIVAGVIMRSGPTAAYTDTTDTATAILALLDDPVVGDAWDFTHVNGVAFACTLVGGVGVTLAGVTANAASKVRKYRAAVTNVGTPAVTITGIGEMVA